jgi:SAM-dependent methyltransferase
MDPTAGWRAARAEGEAAGGSESEGESEGEDPAEAALAAEFAAVASWQPFDWYREPLYYDIIFDDDTIAQAAFLEALHARFGSASDAPVRFLEPACGSGRLLAVLARRGHRVAGFDREPGAVAFAQARLRDDGGLAGVPCVWAADMRAFALPPGVPPAHVAYNFVSSFKHLLSEADALAHLRAVAAALAPGGLYVLALHLVDYGYHVDGLGEREHWSERRGDVEVKAQIDTSSPDLLARLETVRVRLIARHGPAGPPRMLETVFPMRTYDVSELMDLVAAAAPVFELVATYNFAYDIEQPADPRDDDDQLSVTLVLRKRATSAREAQ